MLSGKAPFQTSSRNCSAAAVMEKIQGGEFKMDGPDWNMVSDDAKKIIKGMSQVVNSD